MRRDAPGRPRPGYTLVEVGIAMAVLAGAAVIVAQVAMWAAAERARTDARLDAVDAAANVLEEARARPWADLTPEWAKGQKLPEHLAARWPEGRLAVAVEPDPKRPRVKRVSVEIRWEGEARKTWTPVALAGVFAARTAEGGK